MMVCVGAVKLLLIKTKQPMGCEAQLAALLYRYYSMIAYKPSKLGQTDLFLFCFRVHQ